MQVDPWAYLTAAAMLLLLPLDWLLAALTAGMVHETCHLLAIRLCGGQVLSIRIGPGGAVIDARLEGQGRELICALAGPAGSLGLLLFCHILPKLAVCGLVQGIFNLLPLYPLDGGRALRCALELLAPGEGERLSRRTEWAALAVLCVLGWRLGGMLRLLALAAAVRALLRKRPCKTARTGVQ